MGKFIYILSVYIYWQISYDISEHNTLITFMEVNIYK